MTATRTQGATLEAPMAAYRKAFLALLARDLHVLLKSLPLFIVRTIMQPLS
ncbi:MAG: hypothetical protein ACR2MB_15660 [Acidimicrobiales bacterium]